MDCVGDECNNFFSSLEIELIQKSFVGFMKTASGVQGYRRSKRLAPLKYAHMFYHDKDKDIIYEVGMESKLLPYFRPQILKVGDDFLPVASSKKEAQRFGEIFQRWLQQIQEVVVAFPDVKGEPYGIVRLVQKGGKLTWQKHNAARYSKGALIYRDFVASKDMSSVFQPRIFMDDLEILFVRGTSTSQALFFLLDLVMYVKQGKPLLSKESGSKHITVNTHLCFDVNKACRALTKIALNGLFYIFPEMIIASALDLPKKYVLRGGPFTGQLDDHDERLDHCPGFHQIMYIRNKRGTAVRVTLFEYMIYNFTIPQLILPGQCNITGLLIDYNTGQITVKHDSDFADWKEKMLHKHTN